MTTQSEVIQLTKLCQRQRATIRRLEQERERELERELERFDVDAFIGWLASKATDGVKHPQQADPGWAPPPHDSLAAARWWQRIKAWVTG